MGILYSNAVMLLKAKDNNVRFDHTLTLGRLTLYLYQKQIEKLGRHYNVATNQNALSYGAYSNVFFRSFLGAQRVQSLDYSDYQGADIIHDMNEPIGADYHERFDVVIDGGSLEHVFNFPVGVANCMNMTKKGGSIFIFSMANNHLGHGFYQFSPELFYRIFQPENGFEIRNVVLEEHPYPGAELSATTTCYSVVDPNAVHQRVRLVSRSPILMMAHAVRTDVKPIFSTYPIQSDYAAMYRGNQQGTSHSPVATNRSAFKEHLRKLWREYIPLQLSNHIKGLRQRKQYSFSNSEFYRRWPLF